MPSTLTPATRRIRRRPMAEINVVPYIDVMLVLLVIFMVTAPLLYQGVEVDLPRQSAEPMAQQDQEPVIVEVDHEGNTYLNLGENPGEPITGEKLLATVTAVMRQRPDAPVMVRGDKGVAYGRVIEVMARLKQAGVPQVGLMTQPAPEEG